jgi:hypothetical protein
MISSPSAGTIRTRSIPTRFAASIGRVTRDDRQILIDTDGAESADFGKRIANHLHVALSVEASVLRIWL